MPVRVRLTIRELDGRPDPAMVRRRGDRVLIAWDARALRVEISQHLLDILSREEQEALCAGLGIGFPLPDWAIADRPAFLYVPPALRLPGDPALQGGMELVRRQARDELHLERAAFRAERFGTEVDLDLVDLLHDQRASAA